MGKFPLISWPTCWSFETPINKDPTLKKSCSTMSLNLFWKVHICFFLYVSYLFLCLFVCLFGRLHTQMYGDLMAKTDSRCNRKFPLISWSISCWSFKTPINKAGFALKKTSKCVEVLFIFVCLYLPDQKAQIFFLQIAFLCTAICLLIWVTLISGGSNFDTDPTNSVSYESWHLHLNFETSLRSVRLIGSDRGQNEKNLSWKS